MTKSILVSLAILTLSTSVVLAAQRTQSRAVKPSASAAATNPNAAFARMGPSPVIFAPGLSNSDREMYYRNLRDSGYDKKNDFSPTGTIRTQ
jgi:hypothetical protein